SLVTSSYTRNQTEYSSSASLNGNISVCEDSCGLLLSSAGISLAVPSSPQAAKSNITIITANIVTNLFLKNISQTSKLFFYVINRKIIPFILYHYFLILQFFIPGNIYQRLLFLFIKLTITCDASIVSWTHLS